LSQNSKTVAVGRVVGKYQYKELTPHIKHTRPVKWLATSILKSEFDEVTISHLQIPMTVFQIKDRNSIKKIIKVLQKYGVSNTDIDIDRSDDVIESDFITRKEEAPITLQDVSRQTYFSVELIEEIELLLKDKKHIIFYGPPGTSKTYLAKKFAQYFVGNLDNVEVIQFHPSYSYEDFIEGIKPNLDETGKSIGFSRQDGIFKKLVKKCLDNKNSRYVLIIDEINRGNIAKIFGELIYLLEYREEKITLTYSPTQKFSIPSNLYILGTMNSADRSIAFVDYALRRRFYFKNFYPDSNADLLRKWFEHHPNQISPEIIIKMLEGINKIITEKVEREYQIGHSYFMKEDLDRRSFKIIIDYAIMPLVEQYFFGKKERVDEIKEICYGALTAI
jgi:5-methylcytosine-specific restriction endonuclease McrBC GTP-binding regulatory subunit McrB